MQKKAEYQGGISEREFRPVPPLHSLTDEELVKADRFCRATYRAMLDLGGVLVTAKKLGEHNAVVMARLDPFFKNQRLVELLQRHPQIFMLQEDENATSWRISLQPNAEIRLPSAPPEQVAMAAYLPQKIQLEQISNPYELMQAMRIEIIHTLHEAEGTLKLNDIGQSREVVALRKSFPPGTSLREIVSAFPENFTVQDLAEGNGQYEATLLDPSVGDTSMIAPWVHAKTQAGPRIPRNDRKRPHTEAFGNIPQGGFVSVPQFASQYLPQGPIQ